MDSESIGHAVGGDAEFRPVGTFEKLPDGSIVVTLTEASKEEDLINTGNTPD